jgi:hypothetical protein
MPKTKPQVGQPVQYFGRDGFAKAAVVTMTAETYNPERDPSGKAQPSADTSVSLVIHEANSTRTYSHRNVPLEGSPAHKALIEQADAYQAAYDALPGDAKTAVDMGLTWYTTEEDGEVNVPELPEKVSVRYWNPLS